MKNLTFEVMSLLDCTDLGDQGSYADTIRRQTHVGCRVLLILQDLYMFNVTYVFDDLLYNTTAFKESIGNTTTQIFVRPMALYSFMLDLFPVYPIFTWRYGFMVVGENKKLLGAYYSLPFDWTVWRCLIGMALLVTLFCFMASWLEDRLLGGRDRPSLSYELLIAFGAYCQHVLPTAARFQSRNFAYFVFFLFSYVVYSFYSSNLLSHMVTNRDNTMTLRDLQEYPYSFVTTEKITPIAKMLPQYNITMLDSYLTHIEKMDVETAVRSLKTTRVALLSDYDSIYPYLKRILTTEELCQINKIDLFTNVDKYLFTTKNFKYKEKVITIRLKETGLLRRLITREHWQQSTTPGKCSHAQYCERTQLASLISPLLILAAACCLSLLILAAERARYRHERLFPFVN